MTHNRRMNVFILGRMLGTASCFDGEPGETIWFYDFEALPGVEIPSGQMIYNEYNGWLIIETTDDEELWRADVPTFLVSIPRETKS